MSWPAVGRDVGGTIAEPASGFGDRQGQHGRSVQVVRDNGECCRGVAAPGTPAAQRELRPQGRKTMRKLLDAGMRVFAERGFHAARVDDIVRAARTSHGTFYLYFANKEDLLRALAVECAHEMDALADGLGPITPDDDGAAELRRFLDGVLLDLPPLRAGDPGVDGRPRRRPRGRAARRARVHRHRDRARSRGCARRARRATTRRSPR